MQPREDTPLMKQYWELKSQAGSALLLFRMGDFYELFGDDAIEASKLLEITLTSRNKNDPNPIPMAGVPAHSVQGYLQKLLKAGKKVAIGEQVENPADAKGIVKREVVRIYSPALQFEAEGSENTYLATVLRLPSSTTEDSAWLLACADSSTGEVLISDSLTDEELAAEASDLSIRHYLKFPQPASEVPQQIFAQHREKVLLEEIPSNFVSKTQATDILKNTYGISNFEPFLPENVDPDTALLALGILFTYVARSQNGKLVTHFKLPSPLRTPSTLKLGPRTAEHLDLTPLNHSDNSLFHLINRTRSSLGARQLRKFLLQPLREVTEILERQNCISEFSENSPRMEKVQTTLGGLYDLERIMGRVATNLANPRDTLALAKSLAVLPHLPFHLEGLKNSGVQKFQKLFNDSWTELQTVAEKILREQKEDAPLTSKDAGIFQKGTTPELDRLMDLSENAERFLVDLEIKEKEQTGISSLKVRFNRVFGYYIEITKTHLKNVPPHYVRKQSTVNGERYITDELKKFEEQVLSASSRQKALELKLFEELRELIQTKQTAIMEAARALGELDALVSLATLALETGWVFPTIDNSLDLEIVDGRHPLVDQGSRGNFVPNTVLLPKESARILLITGPNMGGKSTIMRQVALIVILGQMGAPVPAQKARWGVFSSIFTRIGAQDAIAKGQSTFMVEMSELAHLLHHADDRSLLILDEIGRGTSTYDGMSVAWSTIEWIYRETRARTLFATHYHELTQLENELPLLKNMHMAVESGKSSRSATLRFLYKLKEGPANESFGIQVARLAGIPMPVVERAWEILDQLEKNPVHHDVSSQSNAAKAHPDQLSLFSAAAPSMVEEELTRVNVNEMTPLAALNFLAELKQRQKEAK